MKWVCIALPVFFLLGQPVLHADEQTRRVQEELRKRNLYFGDVDGRKTPEFAGALQHYQERKGFQPSGDLDSATLRSLGLSPSPSPEPAWPDVTVLRSDTHREEAKQMASTAGPSAASPPPVMEATEPADGRFAPAEVRDFIEGYLRDAETNNLAAEIGYYAEPLDYFDHGIVDMKFVERDVSNYYKRWPKRDYGLLDISETPVESHPDEVLVKFRINFSVKNDQHTARGQTDNSFVLKASGPNNFKIISMREQRVRAAPRP